MKLQSLSRRTAVVAATAGLALGATLLAPTTASAGDIFSPDTARATLLSTPVIDPNTNRPIAGSSTGVTANMSFSENGLLLSSSGTAQGLDPNSQYISLIYGLNSNADVTTTTVNGITNFTTPPGPCVDDGTLGYLISQSPGNVVFSPVATIRMLQGLWLGNSFSGNKLTDPVTGILLAQGKTVSIRKTTLQLDPMFLFSDIRPQVFTIQACGLIVPTNGTYTAAYPIPPGS